MDCNVVAEEAFGPVAVLDTFATLQEAIDKVNDSVFGLQVGVFSDNIQDIRHIFEESVV
ncbi:aldehyde dehydrogenase family protein [bacterium]|nr:aldehyde dehydrogenase family protein [bacterium]